MGYPYKYNFSASTGFFHITSSSNSIYFKFEVVDFHKPISDAEDTETCMPEGCSPEEQNIPEKND
ncbi:MAG: hypothetical protein AB3K77_03785 [Methanosarcinaceae archaeon]|uniref:hypothetical protein n=1 Tax=Methanosarcina sp. MTP4 TaxID=1434100 RepID=UPI00064E35F1|nr:hypothetical protein [Methanosarcina sp. MTP4]